MNEALARHRYVLFLILALALIGALGYGLAQRPPPLVLNVLPPQPTPLPAPTRTPAHLRCYVTGAVAAPGVYTLPSGALVQDAVQAAGGPTTDADLERLNLAAVVQDQEHIVVPRRSTASEPGMPSRFDGPSSTSLIDINTADAQTLQTLPGIGPVLANRIIQYRDEHGPFQRVDDLVDVNGIGETRLEQIRPFVVAEP